MVINHLLTGMILQEGCMNIKGFTEFQVIYLDLDVLLKTINKRDGDAIFRNYKKNKIQANNLKKIGYCMNYCYGL